MRSCFRLGGRPLRLTNGLALAGFDSIISQGDEEELWRSLIKAGAAEAVDDRCSTRQAQMLDSLVRLFGRAS